MSETYLREVLTDVAEQAQLVDLMPAVRAGLRRRRRRRGTAAVLGAAVAVGAITYGATQLPDGQVARPDRPVASPTPSTSRQATTSVNPQYLPPGATLLRTGPIQSSNGQQLVTPDHPAIASSYQLAGHVNSNTMPSRALTESEARNGRYHPATTLEILFVPQEALPQELTGQPAEVLRRILPPAQARFGFTRKPVTIDGNHALVTSDNKLGGAFRIDWIDPAGYHSVSCDRIITDEGLSGLPLDVMLRVARSLYPVTTPDAIVLDHTVALNDGERLDPPPANAQPRMTGLEAWRTFARRNDARRNRNHLPPGAGAYLALFTTSGDIQNRLVYAVRIAGCHPIYTLTPPTPYPTDCVGWQILDANTAVDLDLAWEGLPSP